MKTPSVFIVTLFGCLIICVIQTAGNQLLCRICKHIKTEINNVPKSRFRLLPQLNDFKSEEDSCMSPCVRYTENITCSLCNFLLDAGEDWKEKPEDVFAERLVYSCSTMDFMCTVCDMIVEEKAHKLYEIIQAGTAHREACEALELCLSNE